MNYKDKGYITACEMLVCEKGYTDAGESMRCPDCGCDYCIYGLWCEDGEMDEDGYYTPDVHGEFVCRECDYQFNL